MAVNLFGDVVVCLISQSQPPASTPCLRRELHLLRQGRTDALERDLNGSEMSTTTAVETIQKRMFFWGGGSFGHTSLSTSAEVVELQRLRPRSGQRINSLLMLPTLLFQLCQRYQDFHSYLAGTGRSLNFSSLLRNLHVKAGKDDQEI